MMTMFQRVGLGLLAFICAAAPCLPVSTAFAAPVEPAADAGSSWDESTMVPGQILVKYKRAPSTLRGSSTLLGSPSSFVTLTFDKRRDVSEIIDQLLQNPNVEYAEPVYQISIPAQQPLPADTVSSSVYRTEDLSYMHYWGQTVTELVYHEAPTTVLQHQNVIVAVIDSGVDLDHPDLQASLVQGYDFMNQDAHPQDDNGHGTHVAGIIAANAAVPNGYYGVAPGTSIMPIKVLDANGAGTSSALISGIQYALDHGADIINLSLGLDVHSRALHDMIQMARAQDVLVIAAAGNASNHWVGDEPGQLDSPGTDTIRYASVTSYPAVYDEVFSVGAIAQLPDGSLSVADFSNVGKVDAVAPGVNIYSTYIDNSYTYQSGTSQAAPIVTGLAARLEAHNPELTSEDLMTILRSSPEGLPFAPHASTSYSNFDEWPNDEVSSTMTYGAGLIHGERSFSLPRLRMTPVEVNYPASRTLTYDVHLLDVNNELVPSADSVYLQAKQFVETTWNRDHDSSFGSGMSTLVDGYARITATASNNAAVHYMYVFAEWYRPAEGGGFFPERSNIQYFVNRPLAPQVSLPSGTYTGSQQVTLSGHYPEGRIYYTLETAEGHVSGEFGPSGGSLSITEDSILSVYTLHSMVYSNEAVYYYEINPASAPSDGSGGGGAPPVFTPYVPPMLPLPPAPAEPAPVASPLTETLLEQLKNNASELIITQEVAAGEESYTFDPAVLQEVFTAKKPIVIESEGLRMKLQPDFIRMDPKSSSVELRIDTVDNVSIPADAKLLSPLYDFELTVDGVKVETFDQPIEVQLQKKPGSTALSHRVGVFYWKEAAEQWEYVGGVPESNRFLSVELDHFSTYAILERELHFTDLRTHWAKKEIETLASRYIVQGVTAQSFAPQAQVTRGQFVTLLARALQLEASPEVSHSFADVPADAYYADAVYAAKQAGLIQGITATQFSPDAPITREQMAVILVQAYLNTTGRALSDVPITQEVKYADEGHISLWARDAVRTASGLGLMKSIGGEQYGPKEEATRAQAATVLYRLLHM